VRTPMVVVEVAHNNCIMAMSLGNGLCSLPIAPCVGNITAFTLSPRSEVIVEKPLFLSQVAYQSLHELRTAEKEQRW